MDILLSFIGITVLSVLLIVVAIIIKIDSKGPALFKQVRIGQNKKNFIILKFRTMCDHAYEKGGIASSESDARITKIGKILRRTSIDELPQLLNILIGQMSFIGPRPVLDWEYNEYADEKYEPRFKVKPGMFCTVDLELRATAKREQQFEMDAEYANNLSFKNDFKTFFGIIKSVLTGKNVYKNEKSEKGEKDERYV